MTVLTGKLTKRRISELTRKPPERPKLYGDGNTLYLRVLPSGSANWVQRIKLRGGRVIGLGLGSYPLVSRDMARAEALENRRVVRSGGNPAAVKRAARDVAKLQADMPTFREAAEATIAVEAGAWKGGTDGVTAEHWRRSLGIAVTSSKNHPLASVHSRLVNDIRREDVLNVLLPIWTDAPEAGRKLRRRLESVFAWALKRRYVESNPARENVLALPKHTNGRTHIAALPYAEVAEALDAAEDSSASDSAKCLLRFQVLTAVRPGEARLAVWSEIDTTAKTWTIPAARMKSGREHRVPLSAAALDVLAEARKRIPESPAGYIFPSPRSPRKPLSDGALKKLLQSIGLADRAKPHGFRSSFRDWCAETGKPREIAEAALAHVVAGVEGAYFRSDLYERRAALMDSWGKFVTRQRADVVSLRA